jgi:molybdenum cofactor synthesis domain-containing protein
LGKPVEPALSIGAIRLLFKEGGKKGLWIHPDGMSETERERFKPRDSKRLEGVAAAVITLSDRAWRGEYEDGSGNFLVDALQQAGVEIVHRVLIADDAAALSQALERSVQSGSRLVLCTGGTGLGPRDLAPQVLAGLGGIEVPGIGEMLRAEGSAHTAMAWLSRSNAVLWKGALVIALPGSAKAVAEGWTMLRPVLAHALAMIRGEGH